MTDVSDYNARRGEIGRTILLAGLVAGILDGLAASLQFYIMTGKSPVRVFQYIASAVLGATAFAGGIKTAALGLVLHLVIAIVFAAIFYYIFPLLKKLMRNLVIAGVIYGLLVWFIMNFAIVPMTKAATGPLVIKNALIGMIILIAMVGIPISLIVGRHYKMSSAPMR